jgi:hypothetical protein
MTSIQCVSAFIMVSLPYNLLTTSTGDIFRCTVSFYHIFQPEYYESMIRGLIDIWK